MPTGTAVSAGDAIAAAKMNLKMETVDNDDLDHAVATTAEWVFGVSGAGQDVKFFGDTATKKILWDASDDQLEFDDNVLLAFGDGDDIAIKWTGSLLSIIPVANDTGSIIIGDGSKNIDFRWYASATKYATFDVGAAQLIFTGVVPNLIGTTETVLIITSTLTGATADNAAEITLTDNQTNASGYARGLYIACTAAGAKTASGEHNSLGIDLTISGNTPYAYIGSLYMVTSGNPTIGLASAMTIYIDNLGTATAQLHMLDLMYGSTNAPTTRNAYQRIRNHSDNTPTCVMFLQANNNAKAATYLLEQDAGTIGPIEVGAFTNDTIGTDAEDGFISILVGATPAKVPFWYDN